MTLIPIPTTAKWLSGYQFTSVSSPASFRPFGIRSFGHLIWTLAPLVSSMASAAATEQSMVSRVDSERGPRKRIEKSRLLPGRLRPLPLHAAAAGRLVIRHEDGTARRPLPARRLGEIVGRAGFRKMVDRPALRAGELIRARHPLLQQS